MYSYKKTQQDQIDTPNKNDTQQKRYTLMPFVKNCILQKWHRTNTPLEIDKSGGPKKWYFTEGTPCEKIVVMGF